MSAAAILAACAEAGLVVRRNGESIAVRPAHRLTTDLRKLIVEHRAEVLALLAANDNQPHARPPCHAWRIVFVDGTGCTAINTTDADEKQMLEIARETFGHSRVLCILDLNRKAGDERWIRNST